MPKLEHVLANPRDVSGSALACQFQHLLHDVILLADGVGVLVAILVGFDGTEQPGAAVAGLAAEVAGPRSPPVHFRIAHGLGELMPHDGSGSIGAGIVVGAAVIVKHYAGFAAAGALVGVAHHGVLDGLAVDDRGGRAMVSAELAAETVGIAHVLVGQNEIDSVDVIGQVAILDGIGNDFLNPEVVNALSQRVIVLVVVGCWVVHQLIGDEFVGAITVGVVDLVLSGSTQVAEVIVDNALVLLCPLAVPH